VQLSFHDTELALPMFPTPSGVACL